MMPMGDERGTVTVLTIGLVMVVVAIAGLAVDGTRVFIERRALQSAADGAAVAAAAQVENRADLLMVARCVIACARHGSGDTTARLPDGVLPDQPYVSQPAWDQLKRGLSREAVLRPAALNRLEQQLFAIVQARSLAVRSDFSAFSVDGGQTWTSLKRRVAARAVLTALAEAFPNSVDAWSLFEEAWPDEIVHDANVINKLYTTIHRMRALGLDDFIATRGDGYVLNGAVQLVESKL